MTSLRKLRSLLLLLAAASLLAGCPVTSDDDDSGDDDDATEPVDFAIWSPDFVSDEGITHTYDCDEALPPEYSCFNSNPELRWEGAPDGTVAFALIFDDPTGPGTPFPHWAIFNIPASETGLAAGISGDGVANDPPGSAVELDNGANFNGYLGSCPQFVNQYRWRLWALDAELDAGSISNYGALEAAAEAAAIERVEMCHVFDGADADL